jgi:hypothetical protein
MIAAVKVATEIHMNMIEYSVSSMPSSDAMKGMSGPTELKGRAVMKRLTMYRARWLLLPAMGSTLNYKGNSCHLEFGMEIVRMTFLEGGDGGYNYFVLGE